MSAPGAQSVARALFTINGNRVVVNALQTGTVTIKKAHARCCVPEFVPYPLRFATILLDWRFAEPMPIWTYAISHPDSGLMIVDAGADPAYNTEASWVGQTATMHLMHSFLKLDVDEDSTLPARLQQAGLDPSAVRAIALTHQHVDHTAAVPSFPDADIWTTAAEDAAADTIGALQWRWRNARTRIRHVDREGALEPNSPSGLGAVVNLTDDGSLTAIHTPGHTPGSLSVRLQTDQCELWFCGDIAFSADTMDPAAPAAGIHTDMRKIRLLQSSLSGRGVMLPSHDWDVPSRLKAASLEGKAIGTARQCSPA